VGYLLLCPPIFVLGPLAGLLLVSRPASLREWWWLFGTGLWIAISLQASGGIAVQMLQAWGIFLTGAFLALMLWRPRPFVDWALGATVVGFAAVTVCAWSLGLHWQEIQLAVAHDGWEYCRSLLGPDGLQGAVQGLLHRPLSAEATAGLQATVEAMSEGIGTVAAFYPAMLVLVALPGLAVAWNWYHRIAARPIGQPTGPFRTFRFNDQLVWAVVVGLGLVLFGAPEPASRLGANVVLVSAGLYAVRGAAVASALSGARSAALLLVLVLGTILLLPVVLGGLISLGLADTWLDFRRRRVPSITGE
jgi:hypothetical protein